MATTLDAPRLRFTHRAPERRPGLERAVPAALFVAALAVYATVAAEWPTEWDSVSLLFGLDRFDVTQASPHAPGYWLYVGAGRLVRALTPLGPADSLLAASALAAAATVAMSYVVGRAMGGRWLGALAAAGMLTSPFLAFYGASISSYPFDALAGLVLLHLAWRARPGSWHAPAAAATLALAGGARQSSLVLLAPLALVAVARGLRRAPAPGRLALATVAAAVVGLAVWVVPMAVEQPGGLGAVREHSARMWREAVSVSSPLYGAPREGVRYNLGQVGGYTLAAVAFVLPAAALGGALALRERARSVVVDLDVGDGERRRSPRARALLTVATLPPLAFVAVLHFGKAGYVLSYLPAMVLLLLWPATNLPRRQRLAVGALVLAGCALQAVRFAGAPGLLPASLTDFGGPWFTQSRYGAPYRVTAPALRETDRDTERYLALEDRFDPATHELVYVYFNGGHRFRHAMLTHPEFRAHYIQLGFHEWSAQGRRWRHERDHRLELAPGRQAVLVVDQPRRDVRLLLARGVAEAVPLDTGPTVYVVPPGVTVYGVELVSVPGAGH